MVLMQHILGVLVVLFVVCFVLFLFLFACQREKKLQLRKTASIRLPVGQSVGHFFSWLMIDIGPEIGPGLRKINDSKITE